MNLDLVKEVRDKATKKEESYKRKITKYYNKCVKNRQFQVGDLILCQAEAIGYIPRKLDPIWKGPFKVMRVALLGL